MQPQGRGSARPPIGIAFDGDLGNRIDAMLAVAMLNGFTAKTEARRISLSVSQPSLISAQLADVVATFYRGRPAGAPTGGVGAITEGMIGMPEGRGPADDKPALAALLAKKAADGSPLYSSPISGLLNTAESAILIRNLLLAQHDGNAAIVLAGPATGVVRILGLYRSGPQITAKCKQLVVAAGSFPAGPAGADDQERRGRRPEAVRRVADADRGRRLGSRRRAAVSWCEHREGLHVGARASDSRRLPCPEADAVRCAGLCAGGGPLCGPSRRRLLQVVGPGHHHRARRWPNAVHSRGGGHASVLDRRSRHRKSGSSLCIPLWFPPRRRQGPAADEGHRNETSGVCVLESRRAR